MPENQNPHQHFKMTERDVSHIFSSHKKMAIFIAVMITVCFSAFLLVLNDKKEPANQVIVAEEKSFNENQDDSSIKEKYQTAVKKIVADYLVQRKDFKDKDLLICQTAIKQTVESIMQLVVPAEFKKFHLELVIAMDQENNYCSLKNSFEDKEANLVWDELKLQNTWLSQ